MYFPFAAALAVASQPSRSVLVFPVEALVLMPFVASGHPLPSEGFTDNVGNIGQTAIEFKRTQCRMHDSPNEVGMPEQWHWRFLSRRVNQLLPF